MLLSRPGSGASGVFKSKSRVLVSLTVLSLGLCFFSSSELKAETGASQPKAVTAGNSPVVSSSRWKQIEPGLWFAKKELGGPGAIIAPELYMLKHDPAKFDLKLVSSADFSGENQDARSMTRRIQGVAGINANFFDPQGKALGLIVSGGSILQKMHRGGSVLTGVFSVFKTGPQILEREAFTDFSAGLAVQAGPILVRNSKPVKLGITDETSRRSGIAVTNSGQVIFYATLLRFPGATLKAVQAALSDPALDIADALNFDGGGSSQLFIESLPLLSEEIFITGGDKVPLCLVLKRK